MRRIHREMILSLFLAFVVIWFGINEILNPENWTVFIPKFLNIEAQAENLILLHGGVLVLSGLALVFNWKRKIAASIIFLLILSIVFTLFQGEGLSETVVRDIGLLGLALALALKN